LFAKALPVLFGPWTGEEGARVEAWFGTIGLRAEVRAIASASAVDVYVVIIDPTTVFRLGLSHLFAGHRDIRVEAEAASADDGLKAIRRLRRGSNVVILVGLELAGEHDALWLVHTVREMFPFHRVLMMGTDTNAVVISRAFFVGADGFVNKNCGPDLFVDAIRRAAGGGIVLEGLPRGALGGIAEGADFHRTSVLTTRESQVLAVAAEGLTARQIGRRLGMQERTVTTHLAHIYRKLGTNSRIAAVMAASRNGLLILPAGEEEEERAAADIVAS
jgi:DNA-binding NarL/FixJ family response regulator